MNQPFDPYYTWLGIRPEEQPPNHYRLLALQPFEDNLATIEHAADARMAHLRTLQSGRYSELCQKLLNEVASAKVCLLNPQRKAEYDRALRALLSSSAPGASIHSANSAQASAAVVAPAGGNSKAAACWADPVEGVVPVAVPVSGGAGAYTAGAGAEPTSATPGVAVVEKVSPRPRRHKSPAMGIAIVLCALTAVMALLAWLAQTSGPPTRTATSPDQTRGASASAGVDSTGSLPANQAPKTDHSRPNAQPQSPDKTTAAKPASVDGSSAGRNSVPDTKKPLQPIGSSATDGAVVEGDESSATPTSDSRDVDSPNESKPGASAATTEEMSDGSSAPAGNPMDGTIPPLTPQAGRPEETTEKGRPAVGFDAPEPSELAKKEPLPSSEEQQKVLAQIEEVYKISSLRAPADKLKTAAELAQLAQKATTAAEAFTLRRKAMDLALEGGDLEKALALVDEIDARFRIDILAVKENLLTRFADRATDAERTSAAMRAALELTEDALHEKRYPLALSAINAGYRASQRPTASAELRKRVVERRGRVQKLYDLWQQMTKASGVLAENPDDPAANLTVGRWKCLIEDDWAAGVPHLAKGNDSALQAAAARELDGESDPAEFIRRGDAWYDAGQSRTADEKAAWYRRAAYWYEKVADQAASALEKEKARKRLAEILAYQESLLPSEKPSTKPADPAKSRGGPLAVHEAARQFGLQAPRWRIEDDVFSTDAGPRGSGGVFPLLLAPRKLSEFEFRVKMQARSQVIFVVIDGQRYSYTRGLWRGLGSSIETPAGSSLLAGDVPRDDDVFATLGVKLRDNKLTFLYQGREEWSTNLPATRGGAKRTVVVGFGTPRGELRVRDLYLEGE